MMNKYVIAMALCPALMLAQESGNITKVIHLRYARAEAVKELIGGTVYAYANNGLRAIVLKGNAASVAAAEAAVKELDIPALSELARNVELTVYTIGASATGPAETAPAAEIAPIVRQLKAVFPYGSYQLLGTVMIRSREGRSADIGGLLKNFPTAQTGFLNRYDIFLDLGDRLGGDSDRTIRFNRFKFNAGVPNSDIHVSVDTNLDVQEGQKVVVGNTNIDGGNSALFVVVSAKFVQ